MAGKERTMRDILDATLELSNSKNIDCVTVTDICARAGISRQTFYLYFEDKFAVSTWYLQMLINDNFSKLGQSIGWREAYLNEFTSIEESVRKYPNAIKNLFDSRDYNSVLSSASRTGADDFKACYVARYEKEPDALLSFQMENFARTASIVSTDWIKGACAIPAGEFVDLFISLIPRDLFRALDV